MFDHRTLKTRQREIREGFPTSLSLRVHRALSWLHRAEQETEDQVQRLSQINSHIQFRTLIIPLENSGFFCWALRQMRGWS